MKIEIQGLEELSRTAERIAKGTTDATRIAINTAVKWGRTRIREDIGKEYNVKLARLYNSDRKKGINTNLATSSNLRGEITVGHLPVQLAGFNNTKNAPERTRVSRFGKGGKRKTISKPAGMQVEIRKGRPQVIRSAFRVKKFSTAVFARGQYTPKTFMFRHGNRINKTGSDLPINGLNATSVATMALNRNVRNKYAGAIEQKCADEFTRQIKRLL